MQVVDDICEVLDDGDLDVWISTDVDLIERSVEIQEECLELMDLQ